MFWKLESALILAICVMVPSKLHAAEISDGTWNGKSWERSKLDAGIAQGDSEALAEWAYCSRVGWLGVTYDEVQIFDRAREAAKAGNAYGMAILSRCYLIGMGTKKRPELGLKFARASAAAGHPLGLKNLANCHYEGLGGVPVDLEKATELTDEAISKGCVIAAQNRAMHFYKGLFGTQKDEEKGWRMILDNFRDSQSYLAATQIASAIHNDPQGKRVPLDLQPKVIERIRAAYECGVPKSGSILGRHLCLAGDGNQGIPMIIEACESSDPWTHELAIDFSRGTWLSENAGSVSDYSTIFRLAREAVTLGSDSTFAIRWAADSYLFKWNKEPISPEKAEPFVLKLARRGHSESHQKLGRLYLAKLPNKIRDERRGVAHLVYASTSSTLALHHLAEVFVLGHTDTPDFVRGFAAATATVERSKGIPQDKARRLLEKARDKLTKEQLIEAEKLIEAGYPTADEFRRPAFITLEEYGDLPDGAEFK